MTAKFDTLEYAQQLEAAGVTPDQAKVHAKALLSVVGNCLDLPASVDSFKKEIKYEFDSFKSQITHEFEDFTTQITHEFDDFTTQITHEFDDFKTLVTHELTDFKLAITHQIAETTAQQNLRIARVENELKIHRSMMGMLLALQIATLTKLFFP
jgi:hypothetical protein